MPTILFVNKVPPYAGGGAEKVIWQIGRYLADRDWQVHYLCPLGVADAPPEDEAIHFHDVPTSGSYLAGRAAFFLTGVPTFYRVLDRIDPDVVYDNMSPFPFVPAHLHARDVPVVTKIHGIEGLDALSNKPHLLTKVGSQFGYEFLRVKTGEHVLTVSESCGAAARRRVRDPEQVTVMPNGIDTAAFTPSFSPNGPVLALCLMTPKKGVQTLLRAWGRIEDRVDRDLLIAGAGPSLEEFEALADDLGLERVEFLGYVPEERKVELYRDAFAYVLPTRAEGLVLTNLEAMASKCLVVSTAVPGVEDYLTDGENGVVISPDAPDQLADRLEDALSTPEQYRSVAEHGYRTVCEEYELADRLDAEHQYLRAIADPDLKAVATHPGKPEELDRP